MVFGKELVAILPNFGSRELGSISHSRLSTCQTFFSIQSRGLFCIMFRSSLVVPAKLKKLIAICLWMPQIQLQETMKLAKYSNKEITDVAFHCFHQRAHPSRSLKGLRVHVAGDVQKLLASPDCTKQRQHCAVINTIIGVEPTPPLLTLMPITKKLCLQPSSASPSLTLLPPLPLPSTCHLPATLVAVAIPLAAIAIALLPPTTLVAFAIVLSVTIACHCCCCRHHSCCPRHRPLPDYCPCCHCHVVSHLDMYRTNVLMYRTMVLLVHPTKVRR
jgi:hypothetical protein